MDRINHFLLDINISGWFVRPHRGPRFVTMDIATNIGLLRSPTDNSTNIENRRSDIQKGIKVLTNYNK